MLAVLQIVIFHDWRHDDAYISYRYAANLAEGQGMVFNPGERVMGSTAPGHVLLASVLHRAVGHERLPGVMAVIGCLAWTAQGVALFLLLRGAIGVGAAAFVALGIALGAAGSMRWVALETNVVAALVLFAFLAALRDRFEISAVLAGLAVLVRPDALLPAGLLALGCLLHLGRSNWRSAWRPALFFLAPLVPWLIFAASYFGGVLPQSASAKFQRESFADYALHLLRHPADTVLPFQLGTVGVLAAWGLALLGTFYLMRADRRLVFVPIYAVLHALAYLWLRPFLQHVWHLYPWTLGFAVLVLVGIAVPLCAPQGVKARRAQLVAGAVALLLVIGWIRLLAGEPYTLESAYWADRHEAYVQVSEFLEERAEPSDSVATVEIGTIGYYTGLRMLDLGGLVTAHEDADNPYRFEWMVLDRVYADRLTGHPAWRLQNGAFEVYVAPNENGRLDALLLE